MYSLLLLDRKFNTWTSLNSIFNTELSAINQEEMNMSMSLRLHITHIINIKKSEISSRKYRLEHGDPCEVALVHGKKCHNPNLTDNVLKKWFNMLGNMLAYIVSECDMGRWIPM